MKLNKSQLVDILGGRYRALELAAKMTSTAVSLGFPEEELEGPEEISFLSEFLFLLVPTRENVLVANPTNYAASELYRLFLAENGLDFEVTADTLKRIRDPEFRARLKATLIDFAVFLVPQGPGRDPTIEQIKELAAIEHRDEFMGTLEAKVNSIDIIKTMMRLLRF